MTGFTFNNTHSSQYHAVLRSVDRTTLPPLKRRQLTLPGKHGAYDFENNTYENRTIDIEVFVKASSLQQLRSRIRALAAWLKNKGQIKFDDEPDKFYTGRIYTQTPLNQLSTNGIVPLTFECEPFAYSETNTTEVTRIDEAPIFIFNNGSVETPAEYTITNNGENPVERVRIKIIQTR